MANELDIEIDAVEGDQTLKQVIDSGVQAEWLKCCDDPAIMIDYFDLARYEGRVVDGKLYRYAEPNDEEVSVAALGECINCGTARHLWGCVDPAVRP